MAVVKLNPAWDLDITSHGLITGSEAVRQKVKQVLQLIKGEWFLDVAAGVPWFESILVRNPSFELIRNIIRGKILGVKGIAAVPSLALSFDKPNRQLTIVFEAKLVGGASISDTVTVNV